MSDLRREAECARDLVREAGKLAASLQGKVEVRDKGGPLGPVTEADYAAERLLLEGLRERFPGDAILSEESHTQVDTKAPRIWCVDPIDGTREYVKGTGEYAVLAGLLVDGEPVVGALAVPDLGSVFWGWSGGGVYRNDTPVELEPLHDVAQAVAIHSRSRKQGVQQILDRLNITRSFAVGGAGYKVAQMLLGNAQLYVHARGGTMWWDSVACAALIRAAGGFAGDARGRPLAHTDRTDHPDGLLFTVPGLEGPVTERLWA